MDWTTAVFDTLRAAFTFIVVITLLVVVHELGHFLVARLFGIKINTFAVFMGGLRGTDLNPTLEKPLGAKWIVVACGLGGLAVTVFGFILKSPVLGVAGLAIAGVLTPVLVGARLEKLYHLPANTAFRQIGFSLLAGTMILIFARLLKADTMVQAAMLYSAAAWLATIWLYYAPLRAKLDDERIGKGSITLTSDEVLPVDFKPLLGYRSKTGVDIVLLVFPVGGFVSMSGMNPDEEASEMSIPGGFYQVQPWKRFLVLAAGPAFSLALGVVLLTLGIMSQPSIDHSTTQISAPLADDSPTAKAGLRVGDKITAIAGHDVTNVNELKEQLIEWYATNKLAPVTVTYLHAGKSLQASIEPYLSEPMIVQDHDLTKKTRIPLLGFLGTPIYKTVNFVEAFGIAVQIPWDTVKGLGAVASHPSQMKDNVGGTVAIAQTAVAASQSGLATIMNWAGLLSISLGVMNLLPAVPLDGGQMLLSFIEILRGGKRLSYQFQTMVANIGAAMVAVLIVFAFVMDLSKFNKDPNADANVPVIQPHDPAIEAPKH